MEKNSNGVANVLTARMMSLPISPIGAPLGPRMSPITVPTAIAMINCHVKEGHLPPEFMMRDARWKCVELTTGMFLQMWQRSLPVREPQGRRARSMHSVRSAGRIHAAGENRWYHAGPASPRSLPLAIGFKLP